MRMALQTFTDPGEFAAALQPSTVELIPLGYGRFTAELAAIDLPRVRARRISESLPRLAHVEHPPDRAYFGFLTDETSASVVVDGLSVTANGLLQFASAPNSNQHSLGATRWSNLSVDRAELGAWSHDIGEPELGACGAARVVVPSRNAIRRLRRLHAQIIALAKHSSATAMEPEAASAMENTLMHAIGDCLACPEQRRPTSVQTRHAALMERFRDLLNANLDRALYLPEVCAALGVSHRTLSYCCQDFLGMAPKRYFYLRRMHMVRRALRQAERHATVTEIATRHGFWEFGRFSTHYKALFNETPSTTLRKGEQKCQTVNMIPIDARTFTTKH